MSAKEVGSPEWDAARDRLHNAVQEFINTTHEEPGLLDVCLVAWEQVRLDEDGGSERSVNYVSTSPNWSPSATLGLTETARAIVRREIMDTMFVEEDE